MQAAYFAFMIVILLFMIVTAICVFDIERFRKDKKKVFCDLLNHIFVNFFLNPYYLCLITKKILNIFLHFKCQKLIHMFLQQ